MMKPGKMFPFILSMLLKKPATVLYPFRIVEKPENFRGKLKFERGRCVGCKICTGVCPSGAIVIEKIADKQFKAVVYLDRCIYCGQCVDSCPKKALKCTKDFELACFNRDNLKVEI